MGEPINKLFAFAVETEDIKENVFESFSSFDTTFYYEQPYKGLLYIGFGSLINIKGETPDFNTLKNKVDLLADNFTNNFNEFPEVTFPVVLGAMKFPGNGLKDNKWQDYCPSDWFIPEYLYAKLNNKSFIIIFSCEENTYEAKQEKIAEFINKVNDIKFSTEKRESLCLETSIDDEKNWIDLVNKSLSEIESGSFSKVVLSRNIQLNLNRRVNFFSVIKGLRNKYSDCTLFIYKNKESWFFGATPEKAASFNNGAAEFDALAGSAARGSTPELDNAIEDGLLHSGKNLKEHSYVINYLREESAEYVNSFNPSETVIKKLHNIQHLFTHVTADMKKPSDMFLLMNKIFPTPAVCGVPKKEALSFILNNESYTRGLYSGVLGWFNFDYQGEFMAALRSALYKDNCLTLFAGCGIVKDSDAAKEFEETELKLEPIISLFI